jgi:hypothetical protein
MPMAATISIFGLGWVIYPRITCSNLTSGELEAAWMSDCLMRLAYEKPDSIST